MLPTPDGLTFEEGPHIYRYKGAIVPSVTQILDPLCDYAGIPRATLEYASARGKAVHKATALYDVDDLDELSVADEVVPYLEAWKAFRSETGFYPLHVEVLLFHERARYAGTADVIGYFQHTPEEIWVLDKKCVVALSPVTALQTAGYAGAYHRMTENHRELDLLKRGAVQLKKDGTYKFQPYFDRQDWVVFAGQLAVHGWKHRNGIK